MQNKRFLIPVCIWNTYGLEKWLTKMGEKGFRIVTCGRYSATFCRNCMQKEMNVAVRYVPISKQKYYLKELPEGWELDTILCGCLLILSATNKTKTKLPSSTVPESYILSRNLIAASIMLIIGVFAAALAFAKWRINWQPDKVPQFLSLAALMVGSGIDCLCRVWFAKNLGKRLLKCEVLCFIANVFKFVGAVALLIFVILYIFI